MLPSVRTLIPMAEAMGIRVFFNFNIDLEKGDYYDYKNERRIGEGV
ncbi:MAG TPA: hypothetical protein IAC64_06475 [Candidatus Caccomorpha excrementavium]|nr:hypothetical protein [Candidatus Caccomorpha excrementavium]